MVKIRTFLLSVFSYFVALRGSKGETCRTNWKDNYMYWTYNEIGCSKGCCGGPSGSHVNQYCCTDWGVIFGISIPLLIFCIVISYCVYKLSVKKNRTFRPESARRETIVIHVTADSTSTAQHEEPPPYHINGNDPANSPNSNHSQPPPYNINGNDLANSPNSNHSQPPPYHINGNDHAYLPNSTRRQPPPYHINGNDPEHSSNSFQPPMNTQNPPCYDSIVNNDPHYPSSPPSYQPMQTLDVASAN